MPSVQLHVGAEGTVQPHQRKLLGYEPKWSFDEGIRKFTEWVNTQDVQEDKYESSIEEMKKKGLYK